MECETIHYCCNNYDSTINKTQERHSFIKLVNYLLSNFVVEGAEEMSRRK